MSLGENPAPAGERMSSGPPPDMTSMSPRSRVVPLVVAGLIAGTAVLVVLAVLGDVGALLGFDTSGWKHWAAFESLAAGLALAFLAVLGLVLGRQFARLRTLSDDLRLGEEKFRLYAELG